MRPQVRPFWRHHPRVGLVNFDDDGAEWLGVSGLITGITHIAVGQRRLLIEAGVDERFADQLACQLILEMVRGAHKHGER